MKPLITLALALFILSGCAQAEIESPAPEPIVFSYGYGTHGVVTMPFGDDGPVVVECMEYYE